MLRQKINLEIYTCPNYIFSFSSLWRILGVLYSVRIRSLTHSLQRFYVEQVQVRHKGCD